MHFSSAFFSLLSIHTGITSSAIWLRIFAIVAGIKKYKSLIEKNKKNYDKVVLLVNSKLNSIEIKISKASIDQNISHDEFFFINNLLKEYQ